MIGLPAKKGRKNISQPCKLRLQPFIKPCTPIKGKGMLHGWFRLPAHNNYDAAFLSYHIAMLRWFVKDNIVEKTIKNLGECLSRKKM